MSRKQNNISKFLILFGCGGIVSYFVINFLRKKRAGLTDDANQSRIWEIVGSDDQYKGHASNESFQRSKSWLPKNTDIIIATAPKTGTTWLQQICHQIRTKGDATFEDIDQVSPWIMIAWDLGQDLNAPQIAHPRIFKSHQKLSSINKGGKYLCTIREPKSTFISWYNFYKVKEAGRKKETNGPPIYEMINDFIFDEDFVSENMKHGATLWEYYVQFVKTCALPDVFVIVYEDLVENLDFFLPKIAKFMGVDVSPYDLETISHYCSKTYMMENIEKFSEKWSAKQRRPGKRTPSPAPKVTNGKYKDEFSDNSLQYLDKKWHDLVFKETGIKSYEEMCVTIRQFY